MSAAAVNENVTDYYEVLGLPRTAHTDDIKKAFRAKARLIHPDKRIAPSEEDNRKFDVLNVAYRTLVDPDLRHLYNVSYPHEEKKLAIEGNEMFRAFEELRKYGKYTQVLELLAMLERDYGHIKFREGEDLCEQSDASECESLFLLGHVFQAINHKSPTTDSSKKPNAKPKKPIYSEVSVDRTVLCLKHKRLHVCDNECTSSQKQCPLFAKALVENYINELKSQWVLCTSKAALKGRGYWFNTKTGTSVWEEPAIFQIKTGDSKKAAELAKLEQEHKRAKTPQASNETDTKTEVSNKVEQDKKEEDKTKPSTPHKCSESCKPHYQKFGTLDVWVCLLSGHIHLCTYLQCDFALPHADGRVICWLSLKQYGFENLAATKVNPNGPLEDISTRKRVLDNHIEIDVPWGLNIGEEPKEKKETLTNKRAKRYYRILAESQKQKAQSSRKRRKFWKEEGYASSEENSANEQDEDQDQDQDSEDIYEGVEESVYHRYGAALIDFNDEYDTSEVGDYKTRLAFDGAFEVAEEEEEEEEGHAQEYTESIDVILLEDDQQRSRIEAPK